MTNKEHYADYTWIKVKRYTDDETKSWEDRYKSLDDHHLKETTFLISEVRSLAEKLDVFEATTKEQEDTLANAKKRQDREDIMRSFLVMWFGFAYLVGWILSWFVEKKTTYETWYFLTVLAAGGVCSFFFCRYKWKQEHASAK